MPFAVFRRHQRKLLAIFAIMAMFAFVLADSLPSLLRSGGLFGGQPDDPEVVQLWGRSIRRSDLQRLALQRQRANAFMSRLLPGFSPQIFGGTSTRELVDAMILEREADRLGLPATREFGNRWLNSVFQGRLRPEDFDRAVRESFENYSGEQMLEDIAGQVRLLEVRRLPGAAEYTPLDIYQAYRDQSERVSALAVAFPVSDYVDKVADPSDPDLRAYYDRYKDVLPDPNRDTPGFKIPRKIRVEYVWMDAAALADKIKPSLTEKELRELFAQRKAEFPVPPPEGRVFEALPIAVFAGDSKAELTPPLTDWFRELRPLVESTLADERARDKVEARFSAIREAAMDPFSDEYGKVLDENHEPGAKAQKPLPTPGDRVKQAAAKEGEGLSYESTPMLTREQAEKYGTISTARVGTSAQSDTKTFAESFFDPKEPLYVVAELTDPTRRYLAWKIDDQPPRVPSLDEIRAEVVHAWKMEKARGLAESDARGLADSARTKGGDLRAVAGKREVVTTEPITKMLPGLMLGPMTQPIPSRPNAIPQIPDAGEALRDAYFALQPKQVVVEPNQPKTIYYALALNARVPADFDRLFDPFGPRLGIQQEVAQDAQRRLDEDWMSALRTKAGLRAGWTPADETKGEPASPNG
jgi:peptidyl-prolyl cis-trans isomerase D